MHRDRCGVGTSLALLGTHIHTPTTHNTAAGPDADLSALQGHTVHVVNADKTLTFEHTYTWWGNRRKLRVTAQPNVTLSMAHVPWHCRRAQTVVLGPLTADDVDVLSFVNAPPASGWDRWLLPQSPKVAIMAQGLQRALESGTGKVMSVKVPSDALMVGSCVKRGDDW